jgi:hypothetical protein
MSTSPATHKNLCLVIPVQSFDEVQEIEDSLLFLLNSIEVCNENTGKQKQLIAVYKLLDCLKPEYVTQLH